MMNRLRSSSNNTQTTAPWTQRQWQVLGLVLTFGLIGWCALLPPEWQLVPDKANIRGNRTSTSGRTIPPVDWKHPSESLENDGRNAETRTSVSNNTTASSSSPEITSKNISTRLTNNNNNNNNNTTNITRHTAEPDSCRVIHQRYIVTVHKMGYIMAAELAVALNRQQRRQRARQRHQRCDNNLIQFLTIEQGNVTASQKRTTMYQMLVHLITHEAWRQGSQHPFAQQWQNAMQEETNQASNPQTRQPPAFDFRTLILTRHWYDTLVSGYLYHKSGRECWLSMHGHTAPQPGWLFRWNWTQFIDGQVTTMEGNKDEGIFLDKSFPTDWAQHIRPTLVWNATNNATADKKRHACLCAFLNRAPVEVGMRVYMHIAWSLWLRPLLDLKQLLRMITGGQNESNIGNYNGNNNTGNVKGTTVQNQSSRIRFMCFEELNEKNRDVAMTDMMNFFFPSSSQASVETKQQQQHVQQSARKHNATKLSDDNATIKVTSHQGHASTQNQTLKQEMYKVVERVDQQYYHGRLLQASQEFGCLSSMAT